MNANTPTGTETRSEPLQNGAAIFVEDTHRITLAMAQIRELERELLRIKIEQLFFSLCFLAVAFLAIRNRFFADDAS